MRIKFAGCKASVLSVLLACVLLTGAVSQIGCTNSDVTTSLGIAASNSNTLAAQAEGVYGVGDSRAKRIRDWAGKISRLKTDFGNATTPEEQVKLLPTLNATLDFFDTDVLPFLKLSPTSYLIAVAIEDALRLAANHFVKTADKVQQVAPAKAMSTMESATGIDVAQQANALRVSAKKRLRARDAKTGRFVSLEYAQQHPDTTVIERVAR